MKKYPLNSLAFKITLTVIGALFYVSLFAQDVSDVRFRQDGDEVIIDYSLDKKSTISVFVSTNGGRTFGDALEKVKGDVGNNVSAGENRIVWTPLAETGGIRGDDIAFRVIATPKSRRFTDKVFFNNYIVGVTMFAMGGGGFGINVGSVRSVGWYADIFAGIARTWRDSNSPHSRIVMHQVSFSVGPVFRLTQNSALSVGIGMTFPDLTGGADLSVGYSYFIKSLSLTAQVSTINFDSLGMRLGVGWCLRR